MNYKNMYIERHKLKRVLDGDTNVLTTIIEIGSASIEPCCTGFQMRINGRLNDVNEMCILN